MNVWRSCTWIALLLCPTVLSAQTAVEAVPGEPFGVGTVTVPIAPAGLGQLAQTGGFAIEEAGDRVFYPAFSNTRFRGLVESGGQLTVHFLFTGGEPLRLTVFVPQPVTFDVLPQPQPPRQHERLFTQWWRQYNTAARQLADDNDYPPLVQTYLTSMLGNRLNLQPPLLTRIQQNRQPTELQQTLELLVGTEKIRVGLMRQAMQPRGGPEPLDFPVPPDVLWTPLSLPPAEIAPAIEPIALRVPEECFYVRFGSFDNYLWLSRLMREYGGDIGRMVTLRGYDAHPNERFQQQIVLQESALSEMFGSAVVADVALIGRDLYMQDGAAMGVLFQVKNSFAFTADLNSKRRAAADDLANNATLETIELANRKVSFLSSPDNRLRSFYVVDGDYHLVTSSREIARRFLETGTGSASLGASAEFQHARIMMPLEREDTIFAYFSTAFFRGLVSPQYHIEVPRRLRAATDMQLVLLAQLAARAEGQPDGTLDELVAGGFLPPGFGRDVDGSGPILERDRVLDSLRGARGSFTPIPDVELRGVTATENDTYLQRAAYYQQNWRQMDPLMVGVKRFALDGERLERIAIDANVSPLAEEKYGWIMSLIGPPTDVRIVTPPDELISMQATVKGGLLAPGLPVHHVFLGVRDAPPGANLTPQGIFEVLRMLRETPGYLGSWPALGFLDWLPFNLGGTQTDAFGFSQLLFGLSRWQGDGFSVLSFQPDVLVHTVNQLHVEPTENPAQIRLHIGDVSTSQLSRFFSFLNHERATQTSMGNAQLLHTLSQQLHVPRGEALTAAQRLLNVDLTCSLGGEYELAESPGGLQSWRSTAWLQPGQPIPEDYRAPLLGWFRGLNLDLTKFGDRLVMHAELDMQRAPAEKPKLDLPLFNLFGGEKKDDE